MAVFVDNFVTRNARGPRLEMLEVRDSRTKTESALSQITVHSVYKTS